MIESNDIWSVMAYIWEWMRNTIWFQGEIFGISYAWTVLDLWIVPVMGAIMVWLIRLVLFLAYDE